jgi:hypothetical protein
MGMSSKLQPAFHVDAAQLDAQLSEFFKGQLERLGLTDDQIDQQSLKELESGLEAVNDALKTPESFGVLRVKITAEARLLVTSAQNDFHYEVGIMPLLLRAKRHLIEKLAVLKSAEEIRNLAELVSKVADQPAKQRLHEELTQLEEKSSSWKDRYDEVQEQQAIEVSRMQAEAASLGGKFAATAVSLKVHRLISGVLMAVTGLWVIFDSSWLARWHWLAGHPKKFSLEITSALAVIGVAWSMADANETRRWFALGSIVVAAVLGIIQLL